MAYTRVTNFNSSFPLVGGHLQTILPHLIRKPKNQLPVRQRIELQDSDFIDFDLYRAEQVGNSLAIISHGLEGSSTRPYVTGMTAELIKFGWDVVAWNMRGCSGELNKLLRFYHSGESKDLLELINYINSNFNYTNIVLIGFSVGGNITIKLLGEDHRNLPASVKGGFAISVPCDLASSAEVMASRSNRIYMKYFLKSLTKKIEDKSRMYPGQLDLTSLSQIKTFLEFDNLYTAPLHGFKCAAEYWERSSCLNYLDGISLPCLLVSSRNDPFLSDSCFPKDRAKNHTYFDFEELQQGGHVGFMSSVRSKTTYAEQRCIKFISDLCL